MGRVIVLNYDYTYINTISWKKAIKLIIKNKAVVLKYMNKIVNTAEHVAVKIPAVVKLLKIIRVIYKSRVPFSKKNVMIRDNYTCQYCGTRKGLTIDHVIPVSRGGKSNFDNCITACKECNNKKSDKLPSEVNMFIKNQPSTPTISEFIRIRAEREGIANLLKEFGVY